LINYFFRFLADNIRRLRNRPSEPFLLNYSITFRCNLDCKYCGIGRMENNYAGEELSLADISRFLSDPMLKKLKIAVISGGEPFLRDDFNDIMLEFQKKVAPQIFHITSNGYLTGRIIDSVRFLKKHGLNIELKLSIDDIGDKHDVLRNKSGCFDRVVDTAQKLRSFFHKNELYIGINQTIFEENYRSILEVKKLAHSLDAAHVGFIGLQKRPLHSGAAGADYGLVKLSTEVREYLMANLKDIYNWRSYFTNNSKFSEEVILKHYIKGQVELLKGAKLAPYNCMSLFSYFRLNPNGDVITCSYDLDRLGNVKLESYSSILAKEITKDKLMKVKKCGRCWLGCEVSPSWVSSLFNSIKND